MLSQDIQTLNFTQSLACVQVMDSLVVSLSKFTAALTPGAVLKPIVAFGFDDKGRMATETIFTVANRYANHSDVLNLDSLS